MFQICCGVVDDAQSSAPAAAAATQVSWRHTLSQLPALCCCAGMPRQRLASECSCSSPIACCSLCVQEWNEIQYNGVYWEPPLGPGKPGVLEEGKSYTFKYPRPPR